MECTKCHLIKELAKGKRWCKDCKNSYELERKSKMSNEQKNKLKETERKRYYNKKNNIQENQIVINNNEVKICSVCFKEKTLDNYYIARCKGNIRSSCIECSSFARKKYYEDNKTKINTQTSNYKKEKIKNNPLFKLEVRLRSRIYSAFVSQSSNKTERTWKYISCSPKFFQEWIEYQFYDGMTMDNYGKFWHIDHVKPCSSYNLDEQSEIENCFNWKNLRPLLASKNHIKKDKIDVFEILLQELKVKCFMKQKGIN